MKNRPPFQSLLRHTTGDLLFPGDDNFDEAKEIWNARLMRDPAAILRCANTDDVAQAVRFARGHGIQLAVRGGGHSYAGLGTREDALLVDLSRMNGIDVDPSREIASVGPGARWGEVYCATLPHGLAPTGGTVSSVGVSGFTLGGGTGWLARRHGLALDNLLSAEVVTAHGEILQASNDKNEDLFWGLRGGAGNFGVVTRFEFALHRVPEQVFAGQVFFSLDTALKVLKVYREVMAEAPDSFTCYAAIFRIPPIEAFPADLHGQVVLDLIFGHLGDLAEGEAISRPLREAATPLIDLSGPQTCADLFKTFDAGTPPGQRWYSRARYIEDLDNATIETVFRHAKSMPGAFTFAYFEPMGGAIACLAPDATAFPHRNASFGFHILAGWMEPADDEAAMEWTRAFDRDIAPGHTGVYVNLLAEDEPGRIDEAFGSNLNRLKHLKSKWDPDNLLNGNQNIPPG